jgi:prepilin-type N-terminal cleavage/methylation domain-containing protein
MKYEVRSTMYEAMPLRAARRGFSLIEAIVAMVVGSTIFGISVELLALATRETSTGRDRSLSTETLSRLAEQFRGDVHAAEAVSQAKKGAGQILWTLKMPDDKRVEYEPRADGLRRTEYSGDKVHARDAFALPADDVRLELKPTEKPLEATLLIKRDGSATNDNAGYELRIDARVGRDLRFGK